MSGFVLICVCSVCVDVISGKVMLVIFLCFLDGVVWKLFWCVWWLLFCWFCLCWFILLIWCCDWVCFLICVCCVFFGILWLCCWCVLVLVSELNWCWVSLCWLNLVWVFGLVGLWILSMYVNCLWWGCWNVMFFLFFCWDGMVVDCSVLWMFWCC